LKNQKDKIISDLGDSRGPYITSQASDAGASYGMAGELRSDIVKETDSDLPHETECYNQRLNGDDP
jgi:hypothetical protein